MPTLTKDQKIFIVQRLACFDPVGQVQKDLKTVFGVDVPHQQLSNYDPKNLGGKD